MGFVSKRGIFLPFRGRKGDIMNEIYYFLFQLILVVVVLLALFQFTNDVASNLAFEKRFISVDIGLLTTVVNYVPGIFTTTFSPIPLNAPLEAVLKDNLVMITEQGVDISPTVYWFLSANHTKVTEEAVSLKGIPVPGSGSEETVVAPKITFFKAGRRVFFDDTEVNPFQQVCPVLDTPISGDNDGVAIVKVLPDAKDYSDGDIPTNRIATSLVNKYGSMFSQSDFTYKEIASSPKPVCLANLRELPDLIIAIGDSREDREAGTLVVYFPVDSASLRSRKFACFLLNELLTPESEVVYAQIMPVFVENIKRGSHLCLFSDRAIKEQPVTVFLDISGFSEGQMDVDNVVEAIHSAVLRYYGDGSPEVEGMTLSVIPSGESDQDGTLEYDFIEQQDGQEDER